MEEKGTDVKEDACKTEENNETDVLSLPLPEPMPLDLEGNLIETRIPLDLKPTGKSKSPDFLASFSNVKKKCFLDFHVVP